MKYHKIVSPHLRNPETKRLMLDKFSTQEFEYLANTPWMWTEKIDGTNIRVIWDGYQASFAGRTDRAIIPPHLETYLGLKFGNREAETLFEQQFGEVPAVLYGEGFGAKINGGEKYCDTASFAIFDVRVGDLWLSRENVLDVAAGLGCQFAPRAFPSDNPSLNDVVEMFRTQTLTSFYGTFDAEGVVGYPVVGLLDRQGNRIITKIKSCDYLGL